MVIYFIMANTNRMCGHIVTVQLFVSVVTEFQGMEQKTIFNIRLQLIKRVGNVPKNNAPCQTN